MSIGPTVKIQRIRGGKNGKLIAPNSWIKTAQARWNRRRWKQSQDDLIPPKHQYKGEFL